MDVLRSRRGADPATSYTAQLMQGGADAIGKKIMEEAYETCLAGREADREQLVREMADLLYHVLVLAAFRDVSVEQVAAEMDRRAGTSGLAEKASRGTL
jgi:phosphoribosyl-ATP pyrophosphohydrolase